MILTKNNKILTFVGEYMDYCAGLGVYLDTARFVPANTFFKNSDITTERTVECYELVLFLKTGGYAFINGKKHAITAGSIRFHKPGDKVYSCRFNEIYVIHFTVNDTEKGKKIFDTLPSFINLPDIENVVTLFKKLITALVSHDDFSCICLFWELFGNIKNQFQTQQTTNDQYIVSKIKKYIDENFSQRLTLKELAKNFYLHPIYLQRKFNQDTGITPTEYLKNVRLSKAKAYLLTTNYSIDYISELCGFCNTSYFINVFKKSENLTPFQFKHETDINKMQL